jgi:peroxisome-assembly ATPase
MKQRAVSSVKRFFSTNSLKNVNHICNNNNDGVLITPLTRYRQAVNNGTIIHDAKQLKVVDELEDLFLSLKDTDNRSQVPPIPDFLNTQHFKQNTVFHKLEKTIKNKMRKLQHKEVPKGLYIHGGVGIGKSYLMDLLFDCCIDSGITIERGAKRIHFHEFMKEVHQDLHTIKSDASYNSNGRDIIYDPLPLVARKISAESKLLCFDEFQVTDIGDAVILKGLFSSLFDFGVVVVATSNRAPNELYDGGLNRGLFLPFIDFLNERCNIVHLPSEHDYRAHTLNQNSNMYFKTPLSDNTTNELWEMFYEFSNMQKGQLEHIDVGFNRKLRIENAYINKTNNLDSSNSNVAFFNFDELCNRPLSAVDYLSIARTFDYVIVNNVPILDENQHNEARRFITMVDAIYESGTLLILGSDASCLDHLFSCNFNPNGTGVTNKTNLDEDEDANIKVWINAEGGSSSSSSTTMIGEMEWSATGRAGASLAEYSASKDVSFAFARAKSRLEEMQGLKYQSKRSKQY